MSLAGGEFCRVALGYDPSRARFTAVGYTSSGRVLVSGIGSISPMPTSPYSMM